MATQSKAQLLNEVHTLLKKRYKPKADRGNGRLSVLEAVIYGLCHEATTREQANQALSRFKDGFFDWNEVRVSSIEEIQTTLAGLSDTEARGQRIRRFLRQLFERTYGFSLEAQTKKSLKDAIKSLQEYEALGSDYVLATVIQQALGGHAIPVDEPARRVLERLGHRRRPRPTIPALRAVLERAVPEEPGSRVHRTDRRAGPRHLRRGGTRLPALRSPEDLSDRSGPPGAGRQCVEIVTAEDPQDRPRQEQGTGHAHQDRQGKGDRQEVNDLAVFDVPRRAGSDVVCHRPGQSGGLGRRSPLRVNMTQGGTSNRRRVIMVGSIRRDTPGPGVPFDRRDDDDVDGACR